MERKSTGVIRDLDSQGRIVIPKCIRIAINLHEGDSIELFTEGGQIICRKRQTGCVFCNGTDGIKEIHGMQVCRKCARESRRPDYHHENK